MHGMNPRPAAENPFYARNTFNDVGFTIGTIVSHAGNVAAQLEDANANPIAQPGQVLAYLSDDPGGLGISGTAPATSVAIGTNGYILKELTTKLMWELLTNAAGQVDLTITHTSGHNYYLVLVMPDGSIQVSPIIAL